MMRPTFRFETFFHRSAIFTLLSEMTLVKKILFFIFQKGKLMNRTCEHCGESIVGDVYRVTSEAEGVTLLNMVVCSLCAMEARRLQLHTEEINFRGQNLVVRNRKSYRSRFGV
jgi:hypothetical protein